MKTSKNLFVAILALSLLASPALAQRGRRSNMGGAMTGRARANQVQSENKSPSKGIKAKKTRTRFGSHQIGLIPGRANASFRQRKIRVLSAW